MAAYQAGEIKEASRLLEKILRKKSNDIEACIILGSLYVDNELYSKAVPLLRRAVNSKPDNIIAKGNLAVALQNTNQLKEAINLFENLSISHPDDANVWFNLALSYAEIDKDDTRIRKCYQRVLQNDPKHTGALINLGKIYKDDNFFIDSEELLQKAINIDPTNPVAYFNLAELYSKFGEHNEAIEQYKKCIAYGMEIDQVYVKIGKVHEALRNYDAAQKSYQEIDKLPGAQPVACLNQGILQKLLGDFQRATELLRNAIEHDHSFSTAYFNLSDLQALELKDIEKISSLLTKDITDNDKIRLYFALFNYHNANKDYGNAFVNLQKGCELKRRSQAYDINNEANDLSAVKNFFTTDRIKSLQPNKQRDLTPVFILGMPRSGTSLVEQILASHPEVYGAGELGYIKNIIDKHLRTVENPDAYPSALQNITTDVIQKMGDEYLARLRKMNKDRMFITDKLPHNFLYIGFIKTILPNARIIHCKRNPMDTCWSVYTHLFDGKHSYSYQLDELARHYKLYKDIMNHWHSILPGQVYDISYEDLISDPESNIQQLLSACGLEWDHACLDFHKNKRGVATASATQVRKPINKSAVKRWAPYEDKLTPLISGLSSESK